MKRNLGIHIGNHAATICIQPLSTDGQPTPFEVITNEDGDRSIPAVLAYAEDDILIGTLAAQQLSRNPQNTLTHFVSLLGRKYDDPAVQLVSKSRGFQLVEQDDMKIAYEISSGEECSTFLSPVDVTAEFLTQLKKTAEGYIGSSVDGALVTVPVDFTDAQIADLALAFEKAQFNLLNILHEPVSVMYAMDIAKCSRDHASAESRNVLTVDSGLNHTTATLVAIRSGVPVIVDFWKTAKVSGSAVDKLLLEFAADEFFRKYKCDLRESRRSVMKLNSAVERAKKTLSNSQSAFLSADSVHEGLDFNSNIHRIRFEMLLNGVVSELTAFLNDCKARVKATELELSKVVFVGGNSRIPKLQEVMLAAFPDYVKPDANVTDLPSIGAALESTSHSKKMDAFSTNAQSQIKVSPYSIGVKVQEGDNGEATMIPVIEKYQPLPVSQSFRLMVAQGSEAVSLCFVDLSDSDRFLGELELSNVDHETMDMMLTVKMNSDFTTDVFIEDHVTKTVVTSRLIGAGK